jgi:spore coat polysaccharide biosynthesis predicted glycosyltransferase SpsG
MRIEILCRGSSREGLGHLLRARTFARYARRRHEVAIMAIVEPGLESVFEDMAGDVTFARSDAELAGHIGRTSPDAICFDTVWIDPDVFAVARARRCVTVSLSPVFDHMDQVDILFTRSKRYPMLPGVSVFAGLQYAIFSEHCMVIGDAPYRANLSLQDLPIAVCMGGSDAANKTLRVIRALTAMPMRSTIWVLLGEGYAHSYNSLVEQVRGSTTHEVILAKTNRSMWRIMNQCAVAVLAGGLTTIESVYAGLPSINLFERQEHVDAMATDLFDAGVCLNGGLFSEESLLTLVTEMDALDRNRDRLWEMHTRSHGILDRHGSERVLREIENACVAKKSWVVRAAEMRHRPVGVDAAVMPVPAA